jgi:hypothetical protein
MGIVGIVFMLGVVGLFPMYSLDVVTEEAMLRGSTKGGGGVGLASTFSELFGTGALDLFST